MPKCFVSHRPLPPFMLRGRVSIGLGAAGWHPRGGIAPKVVSESSAFSESGFHLTCRSGNAMLLGGDGYPPTSKRVYV